MRFLFVGSEGELRESIAYEEDGSPSSFFVCAPRRGRIAEESFDAIVIPAVRFVSMMEATIAAPVFASGPAELARRCFELGCADFIREPWTETELEARASRLGRNRIRLGSAILEGRSLSGPLGSVRLGAGACAILTILHANAGRPVSREAFASLSGTDRQEGRGVDMRIARVRAILRSVGAYDLAGAIVCESGSYRICT
ncbi:MAG: hypothetical protein KKB59_14965 [Spirochaetes bacterium]|nr:hypothetical protein [Spirochaetota bacterium]